jgi:LmbE family N-acetylglucosaminyl deacetylase
MDEPSFADGYGRQGVTLLVVRPHPDDERLATGGMLASYGAPGVRTGVVICTSGEAAQILDPYLDPVADVPRLHATQSQEVRETGTILGVDVLRMLGCRDLGMPGTPANQHPEAFANANPVAATVRLVRIICALRPLIMVTEPPGGPYAHPDHVTCHRVGVDAFRAAGDAQAFEAGPPWHVAKLYAILLTRLESIRRNRGVSRARHPLLHASTAFR